MNINRNNYEVFFIDYIDGKLSSKQLEDLFGFLAVNPDLEEEFYLLENKKLDVSDEKCSFKDTLKKQIGNSFEVSNFELECIDFVEDNLSESEKQKVLNAASSNSGNNSTLNLYHKTKLETNDAEKFPDPWTIKKLHPFEYCLLNNQTIDYYALACLENDFTLSEKEEFLSAIAKNPEWSGTFDKYQLTKLSIDKNVVFKRKSQLKKSINIRIVPYYLVPFAAAASIALVLWFSFNDMEKPSYVARNNNFTFPGMEFEKISDLKIVPENEKVVDSKPLIKFAESSRVEMYVEMNGLKALSANRVEEMDPALISANFSLEPRYMNSPNAFFEYKPEVGDDEYLNLAQLATRFVKSKIMHGNKVADENQKRINFWDVAQFSVEKINRIAGTNMSLSTKTDPNGMVRAYAFDAGVIGVSRTLATK